MNAFALTAPAFIRRRARNRKRRGLTMLETLLAIILGVAAMVGVTTVYINSLGRNKVTDGITEIQGSIASIKQLYYGTSDFGTDDITNVAVTGKAFDGRFVADGTPFNPWGGTITITGNGHTFIYDTDNVPQDACASLIAMNTTGFGSSISAISVNGTDLDSTNVDPATATAACDQTDTNEISWTVHN